MGKVGYCVPLRLTIYEHAVIEGIQSRFFFFVLLSLNRGGSASSTALLLLIIVFVQIQRPHLPDGHALR